MNTALSKSPFFFFFFAEQPQKDYINRFLSEKLSLISLSIYLLQLQSFILPYLLLSYSEISNSSNFSNNQTARFSQSSVKNIRTYYLAKRTLNKHLKWLLKV